MTKSELFRKMIREEVQKAIREEMPKILKEIKSISESKTTLKEGIKDIYGVPLTLNEPRKPQPVNKQAMPAFANNQALNSLLQETMISMTSDDAAGFGYDVVDRHPMEVFQPAVDQVGGVNDMLATARGAGNIEAVQVNVVPDFSALMDRLIQSGDMK
jgi:hypothetical protein